MVDEYKQIIIETLYYNNIIDEKLYIKCSKPHITNLPYDLRTTDIKKLNERLDSIDERIDDNLNIIGELEMNINRDENARRDYEDLIRKGEEQLNQANETIRQYREFRDVESNELKKDVDELNQKWDSIAEKLYTVDGVIEDYSDENRILIYGQVINDLNLLRSPLNYTKLTGEDFSQTLTDFGDYISERNDDLGKEIINLAIDYRNLHNKYPSKELLDFKKRYDSARNVRNSSKKDIKEFNNYLKEINQELDGYNNQLNNLLKENDDYKIEKQRTKDKISEIR